MVFDQHRSLAVGRRSDLPPEGRVHKGKKEEKGFVISRRKIGEYWRYMKEIMFTNGDSFPSERGDRANVETKRGRERKPAIDLKWRISACN